MLRLQLWDAPLEALRWNPPLPASTNFQHILVSYAKVDAFTQWTPKCFAL